MHTHAQTRGHLSNKSIFLNIHVGHRVLSPEYPISICEKLRLFEAKKECFNTLDFANYLRKHITNE